MGALQSTVQGIGWDAISTFNNVKDQFLNLVDGAVGGLSASADALVNGDVIGLNVDKIPSMRESIRNYINNVNAHLEQLNTTASTANAFKGEYAAAVTSFVEAVSQACKAFVSQLLEFSDKLEIVRQKYVAQDESLSQQIGQQASEMSNAYTEYKESN